VVRHSAVDFTGVWITDATLREAQAASKCRKCVASSALNSASLTPDTHHWLPDPGRHTLKKLLVTTVPLLCEQRLELAPCQTWGGDKNW
jgi:hypothetical protein